MQHSNTASRIDWVIESTNDILFKAWRGCINFFTQCSTANSHGVEIEEWLELTK